MTDTTIHPIFKAIDNNNISYIKEILLPGNFQVDLSMEHPDGYSILIYAIQSQNIDIIKVLIDSGADLNFQNFNGQSALHFACLYENKNIVQLLVKSGANVNITNKDNDTPLHHAIIHSNFDIVKILVENNANINIQDSGGETPLHAAVRRFTVNPFLNNIIKFLIENGGNLTLKNVDGNNLLHLMCANEDIEKSDLLEFFLSHNKIDINEKNNNGYIPLHFSVFANHIKYTSTLLNYGANPHILNNDNKSPLDIAVDEQHEDIIKTIKASQSYNTLSNELPKSNNNFISSLIKKIKI